MSFEIFFLTESCFKHCEKWNFSFVNLKLWYFAFFFRHFNRFCFTQLLKKCFKNVIHNWYLQIWTNIYKLSVHYVMKKFCKSFFLKMRVFLKGPLKGPDYIICTVFKCKTGMSMWVFISGLLKKNCKQTIIKNFFLI